MLVSLGDVVVFIFSNLKENVFMAKPVIRTVFDSFDDPGLDCSKDPGRTKQSFKAECTISNIVAKAAKTGVLPYVQAKPALYGDFTKVPAYQEALNVVIRAQEQFAGLSANIRERFANDPARLLAFMEDPKNAKEAFKLGLIANDPVPSSPVGGVPKGGAGQASKAPAGEAGGAGSKDPGA